jgi:hypothetical protein
MKGKMKETVRKWWVLAIVATLALSLTSCGMKRTSLMSGGGVGCDGDLGYFTIATYPLGGKKYEVRITALEVNDPGDIVDIALAIDQPADWDVLTKDPVALYPGKVFRYEIFDTDLDYFDTVMITSARQNGEIYPLGNSEKANACYLPVPGESDQGY